MRTQMIRGLSWGLAFSLVLAAGCGGTGTPAAPPISVTASATAGTLQVTQSTTVTATVTNDSAGVNWSVSTGGTLSAQTATTTTVTAGPGVTSITVTATSKTDTTKTATATITVTPVAVAASSTPTAVSVGGTSTVTAVVTNDPTNAGVTWSVSSGGALSGSTTTTTVVTAAAGVTSITVTATSKTDTTKTATATVTVNPISVGLTPSTTQTVGEGGTVPFTAAVTNDATNSGVTWSIGSGVGSLSGSTTSAVTYNSPTSGITTATNVTLTATSVKDTSKSASVTITVNPISIALTPNTSVSLGVGGTQAYTAAVTGDAANAGVTWSIGSGAGSLSGSTTTAATYNAPTTAIASQTTVTLTATSKTDTSKTATASITLNPIAISFTTTTTGITLDSGQTLALAASLSNDGTASGATFSTSGAGSVMPGSATGNTPSTVLTATGSAASSVTVTATSVKDTTKTASTSAITVNPALAITTAAGALTAAQTNTAYAGATIATSGGSGTKTFAIFSGSLPAGLSLNTSTGAITGTITGNAGVSTFVVKVTDSATTPVVVNSGTYTITVATAPVTWIAPTTQTVTYTTGTAITPISLSAAGGFGNITYTVNSGTLPAGLSISGNQVIGTPTAPTIVAGNPVTFLATDSTTPVAQTAVSNTVTVVVNPVTLAITSSSLPTGYVGTTYSYQLTSTGGIGSITWTLTAGSLSGTGLTLSSSGLLSGTPTTTQTALSLTFQAKDSATNQQQTKTVTLPLTVSNALTVTTTTLPDGYANAAYSQQLAAAGGTGTGYTWSVTSGASSLTALNLTLSASGLLSGTPSSTGTASFTAQVKDSSNNTASQALSVIVVTAVSLPSPNPSSLGSAIQNQSYTGSISSSGGVSPYTWTVNGTAVPTTGTTVALSSGLGLSVSNNGSGVLNVSGTPSSTGTVTFTAKVSDSSGSSAGPFTYSIVVGTNYTIAGNVSYASNCSGATVPPVTMTLTQAGTTIFSTSTSSGNYSFANVPSGSYTITPSVSGGVSAFYPASLNVTVSANVTGQNFSANLGRPVSGTVSYSGSKTGQIYIVMNGTSSCGQGTYGTSLSAAGAWTVHGVPPGTYSVAAVMDTVGNGVPNAVDPTGNSTSFTVSNASVTGVTVALADPSAITLSAGPTLNLVSPFNTGALVQYNANTNSNGVENATSYTLQWSTSSTFASIAGSRTFAANGTDNASLWFVNGLTNGTPYYFRAYATSTGTPQSAYSVYSNNPVTINAPSTGNTVSGSITLGQTATGPLYVGFYDPSSGNFYGQYIASPTAVQAYSVQVPTLASPYYFVAILDQPNKGEFVPGVVANFNPGGGNPPPVNVTGNVTNENATISNVNSAAVVTTSNQLSTFTGGSSHTYQLQFSIESSAKLPVAVQVTTSTNSDGANVPTLLDIANCGFAQNNCGSGFEISEGLGGTSPAVGDTHTFAVTYSDGTTGTLTGTVTGVITGLPTNLSPTTGVSTSTTPTFTWTDPANASSYTYQFSICCSGNNNIWQIPGQHTNSNGFSSSITSITWGTDPTGDSSNTPSVPSLTLGTTYSWQIQLQDTNGNSASSQVNYQP